MKIDIILAGVGGQGILTIAATIGTAALENNLNLKQSEVHGMSQRGGDVQSSMRISDSEIFSDLIQLGGADVILSVEPLEALRYLPYLKKGGMLVTNSTPFKNINDYPELEDVLNEIRKQPKHVLVDADKIAEEIGSKRSSNIVMLGAATPFINIPMEKFELALQKIFGRKGEEVVAKNIEALRKGREFAENN